MQKGEEKGQTWMKKERLELKRRREIEGNQRGGVDP